ncbi:hypothetical protein AGMMS49965_25960 [Bacteroidia bacterium]|nr:hypothetical protein AGMMS49965_25960 [Bacteroidia bacterium]
MQKFELPKTCSNGEQIEMMDRFVKKSDYEDLSVNIKNLRNWAKENILHKTVLHPKFKKEIRFTNSGVKEYLNQPHKHFNEKNELIKNIDNVIYLSEYKGNTMAHNNKDAISHIFEIEIAGDKSWLIVREYKNKDVVLYSISDSANIMNGIKE